jgi:DNA polymerase-3 subunit alpha
MNYAAARWNTIPIATYNCYSHKSAVHDIARVLHIPKDSEVKAADSGRDSEEFDEFIHTHPVAPSAYTTMLGQIRHKGTHAAGVIIANRPVPIERTGTKGELAAAWAEGMNTKDLSKVGIVKYDILGLTALSQLKLMEELTGVTFPVEDYADSAVYQLFCDGDVAGVFQWSGSDGIRELTKRIAPRNFYDLTTCNALYRPGALDAGTADNYPEYMKSPRTLHPRIDPHLAQTYGVICYQEQVMAVVAEVMGGDLAQADLARRLISKAAVGDLKWEAEMAGLYASFIMRGKGQGFPEPLLEELWHEIYTHSGYSYNLSHASAYTMISYQMAWYKVYHRPAFTVAVLQYDRTNAQTYILDAIESGLRIAMPHVNYSTDKYQLHGKEIYLPLNDVAFLGEGAVQQIVEEVDKGGPFLSYADFAKRIPKKLCNNRAKGLMERLGCFKGLAGSPSDAIDKYEELPVKGEYDTQLEILGYVVPSKQLHRKIRKMQDAPAKKGYTRFAGFVSQVKQKTSAHGPYSVYTLSPAGSFWARDSRENLTVGAFVSGTKNNYGQSRDYRKYRLDKGE